MRFVIRRIPGLTTAPWAWAYVKADDTIIASSPITYASERDARAAIATAKIAMRAARFAKVEVAE